MVPENYSLDIQHFFQAQDLKFFLPELTLLFFLVLILFVELFGNLSFKKIIPVFALIAISVSLSITGTSVNKNFSKEFFFSDLLVYDYLSTFFKIVVDVAAFIFILYRYILSSKAVPRSYYVKAEFYLIFIALLIGLHLLTMSVHFATLYLSLELVSITGYLLVAIAEEKNSFEAAGKYIIYGIGVSAIMLYGLSLLYAMSGTLYLTSLSQIATPAQWIILFLVSSGILFKLAVSPFHWWAPDVYQGSPTPLAAFLSVVPKAGGLLVLVRLCIELTHQFTLYQEYLQIGLSVLAMGTITFGNFSALWQNNAKRLLAYSSIAHSGFLLAGIASASETGIIAILFYFFIYLFMNFVAFLVVDFIAMHVHSEDVHKFRGIGMQVPFLGVIFVVIMMALTGLPPTAGFYAKFFVFSALWESYHQTSLNILLLLLIFGILNTVISLFFYFKIPYLMFFKSNAETIDIRVSSRLIIFFCLLTVPVVVLFFDPEIVLVYINYWID